MRAIVFLVVILAGCVSFPSEQQAREDEMLTTASALTKLATAAEASERYAKPPESLSDEEFLKLATAHDPALLEPFVKYRLKALRKERHAVILVCSADGVFALIEDAGCTGRADQHHWQVAPQTPCAFTLDPASICPASIQ
jgi:hypothetical protein